MPTKDADALASAMINLIENKPLSIKMGNKGRILAESPQRADEMVEKIESYYNVDAYANWRNNFLLILTILQS